MRDGLKELEKLKNSGLITSPGKSMLEFLTAMKIMTWKQTNILVTIARYQKASFTLLAATPNNVLHVEDKPFPAIAIMTLMKRHQIQA